MKDLMDWFNKESYSPRVIISFSILFIIIMLIIFASALTILDLISFDFFGKENAGKNEDDSDSSIIALNAGLIIILTIVLVMVAWFQLRKLNITSKSDFLLRIDERYSSNESIQARKFIHEFYCDTLSKNITHEMSIKKTSEEIKKIEFKKDESEKFIILINFLDFLETVAYFSNKKYLSDRDVRELLGCSLNYYYRIFKSLIYDRRCKYDDPRYYCEIEKFHEKFKGSSKG